MADEQKQVEPGRVSFSYERTFQNGQYNPVKLSAWISLPIGTAVEELDGAIELYEAAGQKAIESLDAIFAERVAALKGSAPEAEDKPAPRKAAPAARGRRQAATEEIEGRQARPYTNREGEPALAVPCDVCGADAYFNPSTGNNGQTYTARQNLTSAIKYKGGVYCKAHRGNQQASGRAAPARASQRAVAPSQDEDELPF